MEVTFHFIFALIKIPILGTIYGTLIFATILLIGIVEPESWYAKVSAKKFKLWFKSGLIVSVGLFLFMLSYWGNHGLGDNSRLPIGHFQLVTHSTFTTIGKGKLDNPVILNFEYGDDNLYAKLNKGLNRDKMEYVVWDLRSDDLAFYKTKEYYLKVGKQYNYISPEEFKSFHTHYNMYWHGWRFWLLP
jgi:hypothetical protein